ncbi:MAG: DUF4178 domain-containing protein [bacterium]|nr:DUF4178 domain-containing protein [bacterium]
MGIEYKEIKCPNCGAPLKLKGSLTKVTVCEFCNSEIDLTKENGIKVGERSRKEYPSRMPVKLGQLAKFNNKEFELIGRLVYEFEDEDEIDYWEEFLFLSAEGEYLWLECDVEGYMLYSEFRPKRPINPRELRKGQVVDLDGISGTVDETGDAKFAFFEGELTWKAKLDSAINYIDIKMTDGSGVSIEYNEKEIEFFRGRSMTRQAVYAALGIPIPAPPKGSKLANTIFTIVVIIIVIICCLMSMMGGGGSSSSVRTSSPSTSSFSSSGGK